MIPHMTNELLHVGLVAVSVVSGRRIALPLIPKNGSDLPTLSDGLLRPLNHVGVEVAPGLPLADGRPSDGAGHEADRSEGGGIGGEKGAGEGHGGADAAGFGGVDVGVKGF